MTLYESNYIRLGWLAGDLCALPDEQLSAVPDDCDLKLAVRERGPYTTTLGLTYVFRDGPEPVEDPNLEIRVYHDARLAEARAGGDRPLPPGVAHAGLRRLRERALREAAADALGRRWARNMLLNKWLEYCADRGHRFGGPR